MSIYKTIVCKTPAEFNEALDSWTMLGYSILMPIVMQPDYYACTMISQKGLQDAMNGVMDAVRNTLDENKEN